MNTQKQNHLLAN